VTSRLSQILDQITVINSVGRPGEVTSKTITSITVALAFNLAKMTAWDICCNIPCQDT